MLSAAALALVWTLGLILILATGLSLLRTTAWWVRGLDFPRLQIAILLVLELICALVLLDFGAFGDQLFIAALIASIGYQAYRIHHYTRVFPVETLTAADCGAGSRVRLMISNVQFDRRASAPLLELVRRVRPDVLLAVEVDEWWADELKPLASNYPHSLLHPRPDPWGMALFSRFDLVDPELRFLIDPKVTSIKAGLRLPSEAVVDFYGLHPVPPNPGIDSAQRDAELVLVGREVRAAGRPTIVAGDLNDVAWSRTTRLFQRISGMLDPRIGRGFYATFSANWPSILRWSLDHVFVSPAFTVEDIELLPHIGSDHFPLLITLCHTPDASSLQKTPEADAADRAEVDEVVAEAREAVEEAGGSVAPAR